MRMLSILLASALLFAGGVAGLVAFSAPKPPSVMVSVAHSMEAVTFSDLPPIGHFTARDGTELSYRAYSGESETVAILVHGSSGTSASMHALAKRLHGEGATVYALAMRGHDQTGRGGDIDYVGQLDDDLADFVNALGPRELGERRILLGFSSGGGFVLRIAGGGYGKLFDRFVLVAPFLRYDAPTVRPGGGGWTNVAVGRIIGLSMLDRLGLHWFESLPVIAFAVAPEMKDVLTPFYSYRMLRNFGPHDDYLADLAHAPSSVVLLAGEQDEIFKAGEFAPLLEPVRPDLAVTIVPGINHMGMIVEPAATEAVAIAALAKG
ncbi:MAG: alpha/beta hydrolase [Alphaproteobacteria bacterium HGW-Alphaproteobacteria-3]|jgi:pimeloyl-ACP methyl ester carboxylesterase|nr:MAG: alpha/beta hydrolase [Alphaproteobacteria bacterium HGW-Alphaproteobacteria-3]